MKAKGSSLRGLPLKQRQLQRKCRVKRCVDAYRTRQFVSTATQEDAKEHALKESHERLDLAIKGTNAGLWDWNIQTGEIVFDERWAELIGYTLAELAPVTIQTWMNHCHPGDLRISQIELEKHFAGLTDQYACEIRMRHKKGYWVWISDRGKVVRRDGTGCPVRMVGTHVDITARKLEDTLIQAERDMAELWNSAGTFQERIAICLETAIRVTSMDSGGLYLVNEENGCLTLAISQGLSESFIRNAQQYSADSYNASLLHQGEAIFSLHAELTCEEKAILQSEGLKALAVIPVLFQERIIACLNLASHTIEAFDAQSRMAARRIAGYLGSFIVQEMLEERNRQAGRDLDALFNTMQDMLFIVDFKGFIIAHNKAVDIRLGYDQGALIGRNVLTVHPPGYQDEIQKIMAQIIAGELVCCPIPLVSRSGETIPVETNAVVGRWKNQPAIYGISRDISDRFLLEQQTRQIEKAESLSRMTGAIAHNFNNLLYIVIGNLELAMGELQQRSEVSETLFEAFQASKRAADLTQRMVAYLGKSNVDHGEVNVSGVCRQIISHYEKLIGENTILTTDCPDESLIVRGNAQQLQQVLHNLIVNAEESLEGNAGDHSFWR